MRLFNNGFGILLLRIFIGVRLIYGVIDNVISWEKMVEFKGFLASQNFPFPLTSAVVSVYAQLISGILFIIGWKTRWAAFFMMINFLIAAYIEVPGGFEAMTPALAIFFCSLLFLLEGPGRYSFDERKSSQIKKRYG